MSGTAPRSAAAVKTAVVLVEPREAGNIGAAARAMSNMGLSRLVLVRPVEYLVPAAFRMALAGRGILEGAERFDTLAEALGGFCLVVGTTRRRGKERGGMATPGKAALEIVAAGGGNSCALVFGREESGLTNSELELCHRLVTIPASPRSESLNLAQAVLVMAYEVYLASLKENVPVETPRTLAPHAELEGMYGHVERVLLEIGYLDPENPKRMMRVLRNIFSRAGLDEREVRALRGIFRQVEWYAVKAAPGRPETRPCPVDNKGGMSLE